MAVRNVGGHGVTSVLAGHAGSTPLPAQPAFNPTKGPANYTAPGSKPGSGLKITGQAKSKKVTGPSK